MIVTLYECMKEREEKVAQPHQTLKIYRRDSELYFKIWKRELMHRESAEYTVYEKIRETLSRRKYGKPLVRKSASYCRYHSVHLRCRSSFH